ncbi:hypothetical protein HOE39_00390 [Candidatus Woesearchaeota archaeon]|jgi:hypothetical protein|nr:hypothetical protein [Candidatus Woesearchaeota archaeon]
MAKTKPKGLLRAKLSSKQPHTHKAIGRSGTVAAVDATFDIDEIINSIKFWADRNAYVGFKIEEYTEEIRKDGKYYYEGKLTFGRDRDFYMRQKFEINFAIKGAEKIQVEGPNGEIRNLMKGKIGFSTNTGLDLDYDNVFKSSKGLWGALHHIFFEYIYFRTFEDHKYEHGVDTGKIHALLKGQVDSFKKYKEA